LTFNNYDGFVLLSGDRKKNKEENCHRQYGNNETNQQTRAMAGHIGRLGKPSQKHTKKGKKKKRRKKRKLFENKKKNEKR